MRLPDGMNSFGGYQRQKRNSLCSVLLTETGTELLVQLFWVPGVLRRLRGLTFGLQLPVTGL